MRTIRRIVAGVILSCVAGPPAFASDFTVVPDISGGFGKYSWSISIEGAAAVANPPLYLARNRSYTFGVATNAIHPFWIKSIQGPGSTNGFNDGMSANGVTTSTTITFDVPDNAPESLFYDCAAHAEMTGPIHIVVFRAGFD